MAFSSLFILISNFHLSILPFVESLRCSAPLLPSWGRHWCTCCLRPRQQRRRHWRLVLPATSSHIFIHLPSDLLHLAHDSMVQYNWRNPKPSSPPLAHSSKRSSRGYWILRHPYFNNGLYYQQGGWTKSYTSWDHQKMADLRSIWVFTIWTAYLSCVHQKHHRITWTVIYWMVDRDPSNGFLQSPCNWIPSGSWTLHSRVLVLKVTPVLRVQWSLG